MISVASDFIAFMDAKKKRSGSSILRAIKVLLDINFFVVLVFRISSFFNNLKMFPISKIFWLANRIFFNVDIDPRAKLAGGLCILHGSNIVIGHEVRSLGRIKIYQGVTVGGNMGKQAVWQGISIHQPVISSDVVLSPNACLLGPVIIGEGAVIGAGAVVAFDVPAHSIVLLPEMVVRKRNDR